MCGRLRAHAAWREYIARYVSVGVAHVEQLRVMGGAGRRAVGAPDGRISHAQATGTHKGEGQPRPRRANRPRPRSDASRVRKGLRAAGASGEGARSGHGRKAATSAPVACDGLGISGERRWRAARRDRRAQERDRAPAGPGRRAQSCRESRASFALDRKDCVWDRGRSRVCARTCSDATSRVILPTLAESILPDICGGTPSPAPSELPATS